MDERLRSVTWEGYPHHHIERGQDWFWMLGIATVALTIAAILIGDILFGVLIFIAGIVSGLQALREPKLASYAVTLRGIQVDEAIFPYATLESFYINEEDVHGPVLLIKSQKLFMPLIVIPLPEEAINDIEAIIASRLPEEHLEEPFLHKALEVIGF